jgi:hypothetical protein
LRGDLHLLSSYFAAASAGATLLCKRLLQKGLQPA